MQVLAKVIFSSPTLQQCLPFCNSKFDWNHRNLKHYFSTLQLIFLIISKTTKTLKQNGKIQDMQETMIGLNFLPSPQICQQVLANDLFNNLLSWDNHFLAWYLKIKCPLTKAWPNLFLSCPLSSSLQSRKLSSKIKNARESKK